MNLKVFDMDLDAILADSIQKHPDGGKTLGDELRNLKHNLNINEGFTCNMFKGFHFTTGVRKTPQILFKA